MANMNMDDPSKQEAIRRGPHEYVPSAGKHGAYMTKPYVFQEYPKMLGTRPRPDIREFLVQNGVAIPQDKALEQWQAALSEWDRYMAGSVVHSKAQEHIWLKANG